MHVQTAAHWGFHTASFSPPPKLTPKCAGTDCIHLEDLCHRNSLSQCMTWGNGWAGVYVCVQQTCFQPTCRKPGGVYVFTEARGRWTSVGTANPLLGPFKSAVCRPQARANLFCLVCPNQMSLRPFAVNSIISFSHGDLLQAPKHFLALWLAKLNHSANLCQRKANQVLTVDHDLLMINLNIKNF